MQIKQIDIQNFKIYKNKTFKFNDGKLVLLTGSNGFGKTTLMDAIEWCLTGDIKRIKNNYESRNTQAQEKKRADNKQGIIKNSSSGKEEEIKVTLILSYNGADFTFYRKQKQDSLYQSTELVFDSTTTQEFKQKILSLADSDLFYKYYVCDTQKSYRFLNTTRADMKNEFSDFTRSYPKAEQFLKNLDFIIEKTSLKIEVLKNELIAEEEIENVKEAQEHLINELEIIEYPKTPLYHNEICDVRLFSNNAELQLKKIKCCGYSEAKKHTDLLIDYYVTLKNISDLAALLEINKNLESDINYALEKNLFSISTLNEVKKKYNHISDLFTSCSNASNLQEINGVYISISQNMTESDINHYQKLYENLVTLKTQIEDLNQKIQIEENGNSIIRALSDIVNDRDGLWEYQQKIKKECPLCGSNDTFSQFKKADELALEASLYLEQRNSDIISFKNTRRQLFEKQNKDFNSLKSFLLEGLQKELNAVKQKYEQYHLYYNNTKAFFIQLEKADIPINKNYLNAIHDAIQDNQKKLFSDTTLQTLKTETKNLLILLEYDLDTSLNDKESLEQLSLQLSSLIDSDLVLMDFNFDLFKNKLVYLKNHLSQKKIHDLEKRLKHYVTFNANKTQEIKTMNEYLYKAKSKKDEMKQILSEIEAKELESVGDYLYKIFFKIIKHTQFNNFKFTRDKAVRGMSGACFQDDQKNNILNILSEGQLGVFMLSYFLGNILKRKNETDFRVYFIDDITSCMDDINVLSFIDILKYQLNDSDPAIDQIFFSTCSGNIEALLKNKMEGFGIPWTNIQYLSFQETNQEFSSQIAP